jgi:hypothetical protein
VGPNLLTRVRPGNSGQRNIDGLNVSITITAGILNACNDLRVRVDHRARCGGPREHGRQAARSKRERRGGPASGQDQPNHPRRR